MGRFLSVDPAGESADPLEPQSWNRYGYVLNNPLKYIDPTGMVIQYSESFRDRLQEDPAFKEGFDDWKGTESGMDQWTQMAEDEDTTYIMDVGDISAMTGPLKEEPVRGMTTPVMKWNQVNEEGKLNSDWARAKVNPNEIERSEALRPDLIAGSIATALFEEVAHALDIGSGTKSFGEAYRAEAKFRSGTEPRMNKFLAELRKVLQGSSK